MSILPLTILSIIVFTEFIHAAAPITAAALCPDGRHVVLGSQNGLEVRSWPELLVESSIPTELVHIHDLKFSPNGQTLLAAGGAPAEEGAVEILSWPSGERLARATGHEDVVYRVGWSPDGTQWATAGGDGICLTFTADGAALIRYEGHSRAVLAVSYLPDSRMVASAGVDQTLRLWNAVNGEHIRTLDNHVDTVNGIAARPPLPSSGEIPTNQSAGALLPVVATIGEDSTLRLWQPTTGRLMRFARLDSIPRAVAWSSDGDHLLAACNDGRVRVLNPDTMAQEAELPGFDGRIHELIVDPRTPQILITGDAGTRVIRLEP